MNGIEFKNREEFADWLCNLVYDTVGERLEDVYDSKGAHGRCEVIMETKQGDTITMGISITDKNGVIK